MKSKELLLKHLDLNDCKGYVSSDGRLYKAIINALDEAINYSQCCTTLKDKEVMTFDEWTKQNNYKFTRATYFDENGTVFFDKELKQMYNQYKNSL